MRTPHDSTDVAYPRPYTRPVHLRMAFGNHLLPPVAFVLVLAAAGCTKTEVSVRTRLGYTPTASVASASLEQRFQASVSADSMSSAHQRITARPHPTGSPASAELAEHLRQTLEGFGLEVRVHEYQVLHSTPRKV